MTTSRLHRSIWEASAVGLFLGIADINYAGDPAFVIAAYFAGGVFLGLRHAGKVSPCWLLLGSSLYLVHVVAIACGRKPPYVEENYRLAENCLWVFVPSGFGLIAGVGVRVALAACGLCRRKVGPRVQFLPKTTRDVLITVALISVGMSCIHRVFFPPTIYATGYVEAKFNGIRNGMTTEQVKSLLGDPLKKDWSEDGSENWQYSTGYTYTSNYERRWIRVKNGVVTTIINDYWYD
jgi:hypothetical protein